MSFADYYGTILEPFVKQYAEASNEKGRKGVLKNAADALRTGRDLMEDKGVDLPKDLPAAISRYLKAEIKKGSSGNDGGNKTKKPKKMKKVYTIRDVIKQIYKDRIQEEIPYKPSDKKYIGRYQIALSSVQQNLTTEENEEAEELVALWNKQGAPAEMQLKKAKRSLPGAILKSVEDWKFSSGALVLCLVAYSDGRDVHSFHVESTPIAGNSFTKSCNEWRDGTYDNFKDWATRQFGVKPLVSDDEADIPVDFQKAKHIVFEKNKKGYFKLPPKTDFKKNKQRQRVIRGYIGAVYRDFTGNSNAAFPYMLASKEDQTIFSKDSVPKGFRLNDPDHLTIFQIDALYHHLLVRQRQGLQPFVILNAGPLHARSTKKSHKAKGKQKAEQAYVDTDDDDVSERESDPESNGMPVDEEEAVDDDGELGSDGGLDEGKSDSDGSLDVGLERRSPKFGPPIGSGAMVASSSKPIQNRNSIAGSSKRIPPKKKDAKPAKPAIKKKASTLASRKMDDVEMQGPEDEPAKAKKASAGKKKKVGARDIPNKDNVDMQDPGEIVDASRRTRNAGKRKRDDEAEEGPITKAKRQRGEDVRHVGPKPKLGGKQLPPSPIRSEMQAPASPVKAREASSRVWQFPGGNKATSTARVAFLRSLCPHPKFSSLVDLVQPMPSPSAIPKDYPSWASWSSREVYLPKQFHSSKHFNAALSIAKASLKGSSVLDSAKVDSPLLLLGLMYREVTRALEVEPGAPSQYPPQLVNSSFGIGEVKLIEKLLDSVRIPR